MSDTRDRPGAHGLMMIGSIGGLLGLALLLSAVHGMLADPGRIACAVPPCPPQPERPWFELLLRLLAAVAVLGAGIALLQASRRDPRRASGIAAGNVVFALLLAAAGTAPVLASIPPSWSAGSPEPGPLPRVISAAEGGAFLAFAVATALVLFGAFVSSDIAVAGSAAERGPDPVRVAVAGGAVLWVAIGWFGEAWAGFLVAVQHYPLDQVVTALGGLEPFWREPFWVLSARSAALYLVLTLLGAATLVMLVAAYRQGTRTQAIRAALAVILLLLLSILAGSGLLQQLGWLPASLVTNGSHAGSSLALLLAIAQFAALVLPSRAQPEAAATGQGQRSSAQQQSHERDQNPPEDPR